MNKINEANCPLCGEVNLCGELQKRRNPEAANEPCWCTRVEFPADLPTVLTDKGHSEAINKACICQVCVAKLTLAKPL